MRKGWTKKVALVATYSPYVATGTTFLVSSEVYFYVQRQSDKEKQGESHALITMSVILIQ